MESSKLKQTKMTEFFTTQKFLKKLNNMQSPSVSFIKVNELDFNKEYEIMDSEKSFNKNINKHSILLKIKDPETKLEYRVYLPARFSFLSKEEVKEIIGMKLRYLGETPIEGTSYYQANIEFVT